MPSLWLASAMKPLRSIARGSTSARGSSTPLTAVATSACGLSARSCAVSAAVACSPAISPLVTTSRSARIACLRASADQSSVALPVSASTTVTTTSIWNSSPSARSVEKVCRIGLGSASPEVSITMRRKSGIAPRSRSATSRRSAICRSERVLQHRQPLPSSTVSSALARSSASSMPTAPNSLTTTAVPAPSGVVRKRRSSVVLPAPRKPVTTVTGMRAPRSRFCRRPKRPAAGEGNISFIALTLPRPAGGERSIFEP